MAVARKKRPRKKKVAKRFRFQLSLGGVAGIAVVAFFLFLWMFLFGIWAGQTILLPPSESPRQLEKSSTGIRTESDVVQLIRPRSVKENKGAKR